MESTIPNDDFSEDSDGGDDEKMIKDMKEVRRILDFIIYTDFGVKWDFFINAAKKYFTPKIKQHFCSI